jgi:hypothetical protein
MHRANSSSLHAFVDPDHILTDLTMRQFLRPHSSVRDALAASAQAVGFCPRAAEHALRWLDSDPTQSIGRLRRTELTQLANSIHRFWRHAAAMEMRTA